MNRKYNLIRMTLAGAFLASVYGCTDFRIVRPLILPSENDVETISRGEIPILDSLNKEDYRIVSDKELERINQQ